MNARLSRFGITVFVLAASVGSNAAASDSVSSAGPLRVLYVAPARDTWHDYPAARELLHTELPRITSVTLTDLNAGGETMPEALRTPGFSSGYDVVLYNLCQAANADFDLAANIIAESAERGAPSVMLHCTMHTFATTMGKPWWFGWNDWRLGWAERQWERDYPGRPFPVFWHFSGAKTWKHDLKRAFTVAKVAPAGDTITAAWPDAVEWPADELYQVEELAPGVVPLLVGRNTRSGDEHPVAWRHEVGNARVVGTTLGHDVSTMGRSDYLAFVANALVWASAKPAAGR